MKNPEIRPSYTYQNQDGTRSTQWRKWPYDWDNRSDIELIHREDGPAIIYSNGTKKWFKHGKLHRDDGPAIEWHNGGKEWWHEGQYHRLDGPALIHSTAKMGFKDEWWINGFRYKFKDFCEEVKQLITDEEYLMLILTYGDSA